MAHKINERNVGSWTLESEPKIRNKSKKVTKSFTEREIELFEYFMNKIADNVTLDSSDKDNQVYNTCNKDIIIQFSRDDHQDFINLLNKFK